MVEKQRIWRTFSIYLCNRCSQEFEENYQGKTVYNGDRIKRINGRIYDEKCTTYGCLGKGETGYTIVFEPQPKQDGE